MRSRLSSAYDGYWRAYVIAGVTGFRCHPDLEKYLADPLLTSVRVELGSTRNGGIIFKGRPRWTPRATAISLDGRPQSVTIEDCFDVDTWEPVFASSGKSALAPGQPKRYVITSTAKRFEGVGWLLTESTADRSRSC